MRLSRSSLVYVGLLGIFFGGKVAETRVGRNTCGRKGGDSFFPLEEPRNFSTSGSPAA